MFSPAGTILVSGADRTQWELPQLFDDIHDGPRLLVLPGARGIVHLKEGDVRLTLAGNLPQLSASPVLEAAAILHASQGVDLDMTLQRGRILVENRQEGPVKVRLRDKNTQVDATLAKKCALALESFDRLVAGDSPKEARARQHRFILLVVRGKADVMVKEMAHVTKHVMHGPVVLDWSGEGRPSEPTALKELPLWLNPGADVSPRATLWHKAVERVRRELAETKSVKVGLANALKDSNPTIRAVTLFSYAALGDMENVVAGLSDTNGDVRQAAVTSLQHRLGHEPDFAQRLRALLIEKGFAEGQAEIVLHLLQGFSGKDLGKSETYQTLINYLQHDTLSVRELAAWNLARLVPQGKNIPYDAAGTAEQRRASQAAWRRLIPPGQVPPRS
jgi:hypothetical protein